MITRKLIQNAIERCIRRACGQPSGDWYAVTLWPDGHFEHRLGMGSITYGEDEYNGCDNSERTIYVINGIPDIDPESECVDPDTGEVEEEEAIQEIIEWCMGGIDWHDIVAQVRETGQEYSDDIRTGGCGELGDCHGVEASQTTEEA